MDKEKGKKFTNVYWDGIKLTIKLVDAEAIIIKTKAKIITFKLSNLPRISALSYAGINVKDLISHEKIFIEEKSVEKISKRLS